MTLQTKHFLIHIIGTKSEIEALTGLQQGSRLAYATDTNELGTYDGAAWHWGEIDTTSADYSDISNNDINTDITGAELEELTDGSETTLHDHAGLVTNGDSHDHLGGDGAQIAYSSLSGTPALVGSVWTPTLFNTANLDGSTAYEGQYMRVGNTVTASVWVDVDPTTTSVQCTLGMSLPVASDFTTAQQCIGFASTFVTAGAIELMSVYADTANNRVIIEWIANSVSNHGCLVMFTYQIL